MSVVNQMLRDLENQPQTNRPLEMQAVANKGTNRLGYWIGSFTVLIVIALIYHFNFTGKGTVSGEAAPTAKKTPHQAVLPQKVTAHNDQPTIDDPKVKKTVAENSAATDTPPVENLTSAATAIKTAQVLATESDGPELKTTPQKTHPEMTQPAVINPSITPVNNKTEPVVAQQPQPKDQPSKSIIQESQQTRLKKQLQQIQQNSALQTYGDSKDQLLALLQKHPEFHPARLLLFKLAAAHADPELSRWFMAALQNFPKVSAYRLGAARYFFERSQWLEAENTLLEIQPDWANYDALLQMRGLTRQKMSKHRAAIIDYSAIIARSPNRGDIYLAMGISFDALGDQVQAKRSFQNALSDRRLSKRQQQFALDKINQYQG